MNDDFGIFSNYERILRKYAPLNEGLIVSHDVKKLKSKLYRTFGTKIINSYLDFDLVKKFQKSPNKYGTPVTLELQFDSITDNIKIEIDDILEFFGYYIAKQFGDDDKNPILQIEPKYGVEFIPRDWNTKFLYHLTATKNINKIFEIGLLPKNTKTTFNHTGTRTYMFYTKNINYITALSNILKRDKLEPNITLLKIKVEPWDKFYLDDTTTIANSLPYEINGIISIYTTSSFGKSDIEIIKEF